MGDKDGLERLEGLEVLVGGKWRGGAVDGGLALAQSCDKLSAFVRRRGSRTVAIPRYRIILNVWQASLVFSIVIHCLLPCICSSASFSTVSSISSTAAFRIKFRWG